MRSMRSMRSMRGGFISRSRGPLQKLCRGPTRHVRPQLPPGAADGLVMMNVRIPFP